MMNITLSDELRIYERECTHLATGSDGEYISGEIYIHPLMKVWLCQICARRLGPPEER